MQKLAGRFYTRIADRDFTFDPPYEDFAGLTFNPLSQTYYMTDNVLDTIFEINRDGDFIRSIDIAGLKNPLEDNTDAEGITWMYGNQYALVMEGGEEMAVFSIDANTTVLTRQQVRIHELSGDPKGIAYKASEDALYWVSQELPKRVVKTRIDPETGNLETLFNMTVDNLPDAGLADIAFFPRLSPHAFLVGQSSGVIMEVDVSGENAVLVSSFSISEWAIPRPGAMAFDVDGSFRLVGKHAAGLPQDDFSVFASPELIPNQAPIADAGPNINAIDFFGEGAFVSIDGSQSVDVDGAIIDYQWIVNGAPFETGFGPRVGRISTTFNLGTSTVTLIVRDDANAVAQTTILVTVREPNEGERPPNPFPQPSGYPTVSTNFIHPGGSVQQAEFYFELKTSGHGEVQIYDLMGREVKSFQTPTFPPGEYRAPWDLRNNEGSTVSSGVYFVLVKTPHGTRREKMVVVR